MKTLTIIVAGIDILLLLSTLICGLWISQQNLTGAELASSLAFHRTIGVASVGLSVGVILWMLISYVK